MGAARHGRRDPGPGAASSCRPRTVPTAPPVAGFTAASPATGTGPLTVQFANQSTGLADSYAWDFDNDGKVDSGAANPRRTYTLPGTYTVEADRPQRQGHGRGGEDRLRDRHGAGRARPRPRPRHARPAAARRRAPLPAWARSAPRRRRRGRPGSPRRGPPAGAGRRERRGRCRPPARVASAEGRRRTFTAIADASISSRRPAADRRGEPRLAGAPGQRPGRRQPPGAAQVRRRRARRRAGLGDLRLYATDASPDGGSVFGVSSAWTEPTASWRSAPGDHRRLGRQRRRDHQGRLGRARRHPRRRAATAWSSFALRATSANAAAYASRESGARAPQLVVVAGAAAASAPPVAQFSAAPRRGTGPLTVAFADRSAGAATWAWDFQGDGRVDSTRRNPRFTYRTPGPTRCRLVVTGAGGSDAQDPRRRDRRRPRRVPRG